MYKTIRVDIDANTAIISLARPEHMNAFTHEMAVDLLRAFERIEKNGAIRAVLLRGEGKAFCVGGDIQTFSDTLGDLPGTIPDTMEVLNALIASMLNLSKPILASVHGSVAGVGLSFMLACDLAIASASTKFNMAYAGIGLTPDGGASYLLPRIVGQRLAVQMFLLPEIFDAERALDIGLLNWKVDDSELEKETTKILTKLVNGPTIAYKRAKNLLNASWNRRLDDQLLHEMHAFTECTISKDFTRGVQAFLAKQKPNFEGN